MSVDTFKAQMNNMKIAEDEASANIFQIDSPIKLHNAMLHEDMILERPEDDSMLLKASGLSLNTTNLVNNPLMADDDMESVLSLQPEKLDIKNLNH